MNISPQRRRGRREKDSFLFVGRYRQTKKAQAFQAKSSRALKNCHMSADASLRARDAASAYIEAESSML